MKFLICGLGSIGLRHLKNLKKLGFNDIIIYSTNKSIVPGLKKEVTSLRTYYSLDDALNECPDICIVSNPTSLHIETALKAANKGCHLYIEKPLSHNMKDVYTLQKIVNEKKLNTLVTYQFRFHPHINLLKSLFESNAYGRPLYVTTEWSEFLPDWHPWEDYKKGYSARKDLGGGVLLTQIHPINYLHYIFGEIDNVKINTASTKSLDIEVNDIADILITFKSKTVGHVHVDFLQKPRVHTMKIVTTKGRFEWDYHKNILQFIDTNNNIKYFENPNFERNDMFINMLKDFIKNVNMNEKSRFTLDDAIVELENLLKK